jgi:hypothetical protein
MYSVETLLRSRHSVESESDTEKEQVEMTDKEKENENVSYREPVPKPSFSRKRLRHSQKRPMRPTKRDKVRRSREAECISTKAYFEAAITTCRYYNRLSAPICLMKYYNRLSAVIYTTSTILCALLCLLIPQPTIQSTEYPL